ncbi:MAG TPA: FRG domain-containing protein [bacterium]|nr:FRG domain-containing protein [bacterium]
MKEAIRTVTVENIAQFFDAVVSVTHSFEDDRAWWRGHADRQWGLTASLHRDSRAVDERNMTNRFRSRARIRHTSVPDFEDDAGWLYLMRHYRLPTRLLDWTESPLIGLFFAVNEYSDSDGTLWALMAPRLNMSQVNRILFAENDSMVLPVLKAAFTRQKLADSEKTLAILTRHFDLRQMVQRSEFTIHGASQPLNEFDDAGKFLARINIPSSAKEGLKQSLDLLRITEDQLFPDLEHLASELISYKFLPYERPPELSE